MKLEKIHKGTHCFILLYDWSWSVLGKQCNICSHSLTYLQDLWYSQSFHKNFTTTAFPPNHCKAFRLLDLQKGFIIGSNSLLVKTGSTSLNSLKLSSRYNGMLRTQLILLAKFSAGESNTVGSSIKCWILTTSSARWDDAERKKEEMSGKAHSTCLGTLTRGRQVKSCIIFSKESDEHQTALQLRWMQIYWALKQPMGNPQTLSPKTHHPTLRNIAPNYWNPEDAL